MQFDSDPSGRCAVGKKNISQGPAAEGTSQYTNLLDLPAPATPSPAEFATSISLLNLLEKGAALRRKREEQYSSIVQLPLLTTVKSRQIASPYTILGGSGSTRSGRTCLNYGSHHLYLKLVCYICCDVHHLLIGPNHEIATVVRKIGCSLWAQYRC